MRHDAHYVEELTQTTTTHVGRMLPTDKLDPNPDQPRTEIGDLTELTSSIREKGVLEPLLVKPMPLGHFPGPLVVFPRADDEFDFVFSF